MLLQLIIVTVILSLSDASKVTFDNYSVYRANPKTNHAVYTLKMLRAGNKYDFWSDPGALDRSVDIMSSPSEKAKLESILKHNNISYEVMIPDVQLLINQEKVNNYLRTTSMNWTVYYPLADIYNWLDDLEEKHSEASIIIGGESYEGRPIKGIKISHGSGKKGIFIEAGIHAREWISPATANYILNELLTSTDPEIMALARDFDWYIFPVVNPDGYVYTHETVRLWRKNRKPLGNNVYGVDLNRNWNSDWLVAGASIDPDTDTYAGTGPFSEIETRSLSEYLYTIGHDLVMYLSFHSYSQLLLLPFGNSSEPYANYAEAMNIGRRAMGALSVRYGTRYATGNVAEAIYEATGSSMDWVKSTFNVPLTYCYEFRDTGEYGFLLPVDQIMPNNLEVMDSLLDLIHQARRFGVISAAPNLQTSVVLLLVNFVIYALCF